MCITFYGINIFNFSRLDSNLLPSTTRTQLVNLNVPLYILCRRLSTIIVAVTLDPKPDKLTENVTINFKHLKVTSVITTLWSFCARLVERVIKFKNLFSPGYRRYETLCVLERRQRKKVKIKWWIVSRHQWLILLKSILSAKRAQCKH